MRYSFLRAAKAARKDHPIPEGTRPYDLRHSFLTRVFRQYGNLKAVKELGLHANLTTTERYVQGAVSDDARKAIQSLDEGETR